MRHIAIKLLAACARAVLRKYQPKIVAVTGTVGKSSAKEAIAAVLKHSLVVRTSKSNYNNEVGVPITILDLPPPGRSVLKWLNVLGRTLRLLLKTDHTYPDVLVLEMGADAPGDIGALTSIAPPSVAVLTAITPVHLEKFGTLLRLQKEKSRIFSRLPGTAIGNFDDPLVREEIKKVKTKTITYGFAEDALVRAGEVGHYQSPGEEVYERIKGVAFKLYGDGSVLPVHISGALGRSHVAAALAGSAVGVAFGLHYHDIVEGLHTYLPLPGRMRLIPGIKHTLIIDDTYNASPAAVASALAELHEVPIAETNKKYAILGDMLELGVESERLHIEAGRRAAELGIDVLIGVGECSASTVKSAREAGMGEGSVFHFNAPVEAGKFVQDMIKRGDVILIKGSRGMRMEEVVRELMAEPERAEELLVHQ